MHLRLLAAAAALTMLIAAAPARAVPRLVVFQSSYRTGATFDFDAALLQQQRDRPLGKVALRTQANFNFSQTPGTVVGSAAVSAATSSDSVFKGATVVFSGPIVAANPADHVVDGTGCTGEATHDAVWQLELTAQGQSLPLTLYVDTVPSMQWRYAATLCLASPYVASEQGGAPFGAALRQMFVHLTGAAHNWSGHCICRLSALVTPYVAGTASLDTDGTAETRALMPIPSAIALWHEHARRGFVRLAGTANVNGLALRGARLPVYAGRTPNDLRLVGHTSRVGRGGAYRLLRPSPRRTTYFQVAIGPFDVTHVPGDFFCGGGSDAPAGCVSATLSEIDSNVLRVAGKR